MAFRQMLSKNLASTLERDLSRSLAAELASAHAMVENMLAPSVFAYTARPGAFSSSARREAPVTKVHMEPSKGGIFADRESWH
jgi:hypothetical protein